MRALLITSLLLAIGCAPIGDDPEFSAQTSAVRTGDFVSETCGQTFAWPKPLDVQFEVDCTGMNAHPGSVTMAASLVQVVGVTQADAFIHGARCRMVMGEPLPSPVAPLGIGSGSLEGQAAIVLFQGGTRWVPMTGCINLERYEARSSTGGIGVGRYDGIFQEIGLDTQRPTGRLGRSRGAVDWCEYGRRSDCPVNVTPDLPKKVSIDSVGGAVFNAPTNAFRERTGLATDCRVLIDRAAEGVRVDLELGFWDGLPITHIGTECYGSGDRLVPQPNSFVFEAGGVTGPGSYGPIRSCPHKGKLMPFFDWVVPRAWESRDMQSLCLSGQLSHQSHVTVSEDSVCSFEIHDEPGKFILNCEAVTWSPVRPGAGQNGHFRLEADCDVRYR